MSSCELAKKKSSPALPLSVLPPPLEVTVSAFKIGAPLAPFSRLALTPEEPALAFLKTLKLPW